MIGRRRSRMGRHRNGQAPTNVYRRLWDGPARSEAEHLDRTWQGWSVLYSLGERRFYAIAEWSVSEPLIISDDTAEGLQERMLQTEADIAWRAFPASPPPDRRDGVHSQASAVAPLPSRRPYRDAA
ncbi:hypothetical protein [Streptosporangium sp. NPDC051022]|uniref:hypothetical protein n=1 Tax=Streptosporangium sp. NPDC051022 TaxID=3155752 RepID=UPI00342D8B37